MSEQEKKAFGLSDLIASVGQENVKFQFLEHVMVNVARRKEGTAVTFVTDGIDCNEAAFGKYRNVGMVLWIPSELFEKAKRDAGV